MTYKIVETFNLSKTYYLKKGGYLRGHKREFKAMDNVNISIKEGEIFGLLGLNGAGKTTLIQILSTLLQPTSGYALVDGFNILKKPIAAKSRIALMLESDMLYYRLTGYSNLKFFCKLYNIPNYKEKINRISKEFGLKKWLDQLVEKYSSGMKMKLSLMRTILLERKITFLDEPTLGLDVKSVAFMINKIKKMNSTIFLTSHNMSVVEKLCDRIAFINKGKIIKIGNKDDIKRFEQSEIKILVEIKENKNQLKNELINLDFVNDVIENENKKNELIVLLNNREDYQDLLSILVNYKIRKIKEQELSLEDLFLNLI